MLLLLASIESAEDRDIMTAFYEANLNLLLGEARKHLFVEEDVEDAVYECLEKLIEKMDVFRTLQPKQRIRYAIVTVRNLCYMRIRRDKCLTMVSFEQLSDKIEADEENSPEEITQRKLVHAQVRDVMSKLDLEQRQLLEQKYILRWTDEEMAQLYGIKTQSLRMRLTRAKRRLMKLMGGQLFHWIDWEDEECVME